MVVAYNRHINRIKKTTISHMLLLTFRVIRISEKCVETLATVNMYIVYCSLLLH